MRYGEALRYFALQGRGERHMRHLGDLKTKGAFGPGVSDASVKNSILVKARRSAILQAAVEVFFEKGYHVSRIVDVAEAAGVSHGTIYNYVSCKEDLLYLVCEEHFRGYEELVNSAIAKAKSPREKLDALLRATIDVVFKYHKHFVVMLRELHHVESSKRRAFFALAAEQRKYIQKILRDVSKETPLLMEHPRVTANILVYLPKLIVSRGWDLKNEVDDRTMTDALVAFMQRGLGLRKESSRRSRGRAAQ
jgi:AcrR family transcriptional regulator